MAADVGEVLEEVTEIGDFELIDGLETKRACAAVVLDLFDDASDNFFCELFLACDDSHDHALRNRKCF
jgi:hypothetical protein